MWTTERSSENSGGPICVHTTNKERFLPAQAQRVSRRVALQLAATVLFYCGACAHPPRQLLPKRAAGLAPCSECMRPAARLVHHAELALHGGLIQVRRHLEVLARLLDNARVPLGGVALATAAAVVAGGGGPCVGRELGGAFRELAGLAELLCVRLEVEAVTPGRAGRGSFGGGERASGTQGSPLATATCHPHR